MSALPSHDPACTEDPDDDAIDLVIEGRPRGVGTITVARLLPAPRRHMVGPFIFLDHLGPVVLAPGTGFDVRPHPHIGLSTVTYFLAGENVHRDSLGTVQVNRPGDVNLMTAGRGVVHSERAEPGFRAAGGTMHGVQIWLALPDEHENDAPSFEHHPRATLPEIAPAPGVRGRVLIGAALGARSPIRHPSEPLLVDLELDAGATVGVPADVAERAVFVIDGELGVGGAAIGADRLAVLCGGKPARAMARAATRTLILGGAPLVPRLIEWNFVASSRDRIALGRVARPDRDRNVRFIPAFDGRSMPLHAISKASSGANPAATLGACGRSRWCCFSLRGVPSTSGRHGNPTRGSRPMRTPFHPMPTTRRPMPTSRHPMRTSRRRPAA